MTDITAWVAAGGGAIGTAKLIEKVLGPSFAYLGDQLKDWVEKKQKNVGNIFSNAEKKLGDKMEEPGGVAPKVLKTVLEDGAWSEEALQVEYFGGVLASSRTGISRDDRGAYFAALTSRLSTYQLRFHYLIFKALKTIFNGQDVNVHDGSKWSSMEIFLPFPTVFVAMDFTQEERDNGGNLISHSLHGLMKEDLLAHFRFGSVEHLKSGYAAVSQPGVLVTPSKLGVELMMWAYGHGQLNPNRFFDKTITFDDDQGIQIIMTDVVATKKS